jgi:hypothetical protein
LERELLGGILDNVARFTKAFTGKQPEDIVYTSGVFPILGEGWHETTEKAFEAQMNDLHKCCIQCCTMIVEKADEVDVLPRLLEAVGRTRTTDDFREIALLVVASMTKALQNISVAGREKREIWDEVMDTMRQIYLMLPEIGFPAVIAQIVEEDYTGVRYGWASYEEY